MYVGIVFCSKGRRMFKAKSSPFFGTFITCLHNAGAASGHDHVAFFRELFRKFFSHLIFGRGILRSR